MAIGDAAAAAGLVVYGSDQDRSLGYQNDNQRGDDVAAVMARTDALEAAALNPPLFSAYRGAAQNVGSNTWSVIASDRFTVEVNRGFASWANGGLVVSRAGVYEVSCHVEFLGDDYNQVGCQLTVNTSSPDTDNTLCKGEVMGSGSGSHNGGPTGFGMRRLAVGDVVRMLVLQTNTNDNVWSYGPSKPDLGWTMRWVTA
ncbi:hypothetical protein DEI93_07190 [Curtobacterium sp. MCBD17_035]|uniref:hypothetical protein n=1 Tax=Curtobacterium sp. MCBD17_035 TaxID=2175673 RepID=UPI000DA81A21|nr:hypothetical protein [Curtobacterium sp. MCBD17_035]WIB68806.1 hypothetical protein DEI93_07190 [Curtobacterium sp. MCBD17_035]